MNAAQTAFENFRACADNAPAGTYEQAKELAGVLNRTMNELTRQLRALGLRADNCDRAHELESAMYAYVKASNPDGTLYPCAEGFGASMSGPARERVLRQAADSVAFLRVIGGL